MPINAAWHKANHMPPNTTIEQRIKWHLEHKKACACRDIPPKLQAEIKKRGLSLTPDSVRPEESKDAFASASEG